ncbi:MAG: hypothetical protein WCX46_01995 [Candidatus Paceibacterota bacterium]
MKKNYLTLSLSILTVMAVFVFFLNLAPKTQAAPGPLSGTATIINTGYTIQFSGNGGSDGTVPFSSSFDPVNGFDGYGWSHEYGWIEFNGWTAKALSFVGTADRETIADWATGTIKLGTNSDGGSTGTIGYGIAFSSDNNAYGYAWGGNVIGWINFAGVTYSPVPVIVIHNECVGGSCVSVNGVGVDQCSPLGSSCTAPPSSTHNECVGGSCVSVNGVGVDQCSPLGSSCIIPPPITHKGCVNYSCTIVNGLGLNECSTVGESCGVITLIVNGSCSNSLYSCTAGGVDNKSSNSNYWTWDCIGSNGGTNQSCSKSKIIGGCDPSNPACLEYCSNTPEYPTCCYVLPPSDPADQLKCIKLPHYIEN